MSDHRPSELVHYARQRREFALIKGLGWVVYGLAVIFTYPREHGLLKQDPSDVDAAPILGLYIFLFGIIAFIAAWFSRRSDVMEKVAYGTLVLAPLSLALLMFVLAYTTTLDQGWAIGAGYILFASSAYYMAGLRPSDEQIARAGEVATDG